MNRLPHVTSPRLDALFRLAESTWNDRADVREAFHDLQSLEFWVWFLFHGSREIPDFETHAYPLPLRHLVERVVGKMEPRTYLESCIGDGRRMVRSLREGGFEFAPGGRLLDFGCGCGRILLFLARWAGECRLHGSDVDSDSLEWCRENYDFATFDRNSSDPPSPFETATFDGVISFSVFSHLPEMRHRRWLEELARITRPGATLVLSVMGRTCVREFLEGRQPGPSLSRRLRKNLPHLDRTGFLFLPYRKLRLKRRVNRSFFRTWDLEEYGSTFILESYIRREWSRLFEIVGFHEAPDEWQDYVTLRRREA